jgi:small ligand-binding sensory domain FIST
MLCLASGASDAPVAGRAAETVARKVAAGLAGRRARAAVFFSTTAYGPGYGCFEREIATATGAQHVVGCSTVGVLGGGEPEIERGPGVVALALAGDIEAKRFFFPALRGRAEEIGREIGRVARELESQPRAILVLADSYNLAPDELLAGIESTAPGVLVVGGGATEDGTSGETTVVAKGVAAANAVAGLAIGGVRLRTVVSPSCTILGPWWTITAARGHQVLSLDGAPALARLLARWPTSLRDDLRTGLRATLAAIAEPGGEPEAPGTYVLRQLVGADPEAGILSVGDEVTCGMRLAFAVRDRIAARETLDAKLEHFALEGARAAGALYLNGTGRGEGLYGVAGLESAYLQRRLGTMPLAGFYCGVGFAPVEGRNRFHQHAGILVGVEAV